MAYGKKDGFSYLDGIPMKISEKIRAPRKVTLPVNFHLSIPSELLTEDYNFNLEREVLANAEVRRQAVEQLAKARVEKVAFDIEEFTKVTQEESKPDTLQLQDEGSETNVEDNNGAAAPHPPPPWQPTHILTPQPMEWKNSNNKPLVQQKELNLADFENETSPFDYMELQTINDLEELNTVFQGMAFASPSVVDSRRQPARFPVSTLPQDPVNNVNNGDTQQKLNGERAAVDLQNAKVCYFSPNSYAQSKGYSLPSTKEDLPNLNNGYSLQKQVLYDLTRHPASESKDFGDFPKLRSAKSVSDIQSCWEGVSGCQQSYRSHTPPPAPTHMVSITKKPDFTVEPQNTSSCLSKNADQDVKIPDPFTELSQEQQDFVSTLTDMGFARARVSRSVKQLGTDYKKVVDYLCLVQSLEDAGYDGWDTEMALHLHNYSIEEAKSFLDLLTQFQDLGFDKDLARKALVRHKNDRDKALDALLT